MHDDSIITFLQVVKHGSFSKAAEVMFLSPNAVKKRIKTLEEQASVTLFLRSNKGVCLTKAGQSLYDDFMIIHNQYEKAVEKAQSIQREPTRAIRIGMMSTFLDVFMTSSWHQIRRKLNQNFLHIAYYGNSLFDMDTLFHDVGRKTDLCIEIYDPEISQKYDLQAKEISSYSLYIGIPDALHLSCDDKISPEHLIGQTLSLPARGRAKVYDTIWNRMDQLRPDVITEEIQEYSVRTFNDCYMKKNCILVAKNQINLYPFFSFFPLDMAGTVSFGVYYPRDMSQQTIDFVNMVTVT